MKNRAALLLIIVGVSLQSSQGQGTADVLTILRASLAAQAGQVAIQDITLVGSVESIAGSDDETASFIFKGTLDGSARTDIDLSSGTLTETRKNGSSGLTGSWSRGSGNQHVLAGHNLMSEAEWFSPLLIVERLLGNSALSISYIGTEDGLAHFSAYQPGPTGTPNVSTSLVQHLSQTDFYLDPMTFLPVKLSYSLHPDNNALVDIPVLVRFSNYQISGGITAPMHIQRYINGSLALDIQVGSVAVNSGISAATF